MFDFLKKKISSFTEKVKERVESKPKEEVEEIEEPVEQVEEKVMEAPSGEEKKPIEKVKEIRKEEKRELKAKVGVKEKLKGIITGTITVEEKDIAGFLDEFELALLESDVEQETAKDIVNEIRKEIAGKKIQRGKDISSVLKQDIKDILKNIMETKQVDVLKEVETKKPYIILFLGPNGAGKTTSIAKLTWLLQSKGKKVIWAASDTFRAASIEQLEKHAEELGVRVVKHRYGADPAAVAFDAIKAAEAKGIDVVMIDSAGRQETDRNLMEELKKINRVAKADLRLYVGEAFTGQALLQQASEFDEALNLDGFILTKIDVDVKGGTSISLLHKLKKPILYIGTGQRYEDLLSFKPEYIIDRVVA